MSQSLAIGDAICFRQSAVRGLAAARRRSAVTAGGRAIAVRYADRSEAPVCHATVPAKPLLVSRSSVLASARVLEDLARRVAAGDAGHAAARMRAGAAQVEAPDRACGSRRGRAPGARRTAGRATARRERCRRRRARTRARGRAATGRAARSRSRSKFGANAIDRGDHQVGDLVARIVPRAARQHCTAGRDARAGRRGSRRACPAARASRRPSTESASRRSARATSRACARRSTRAPCTRATAP